MTEFRTFIDEADARSHVERRRSGGDAATRPWQRQLKPGDLAFSMMIRPDRAPVALFWQISRPTFLGVDQKDQPDEVKLINQLPNMRDVTQFSGAAPAGERCSINVVDAWGTMDKKLWDEARKAGWNLPVAIRRQLAWLFKGVEKMAAKAAPALAEERKSRAEAIQARVDEIKKRAAEQGRGGVKPQVAGKLVHYAEDSKRMAKPAKKAANRRRKKRTKEVKAKIKAAGKAGGQ